MVKMTGGGGRWRNKNGGEIGREKGNLSALLAWRLENQ